MVHFLSCWGCSLIAEYHLFGSSQFLADFNKKRTANMAVQVGEVSEIIWLAHASWHETPDFRDSILDIGPHNSRTKFIRYSY